MVLTDPRDLYADLPQQAPGSDRATLDALRRIELPPRPRVIDLGCGTGRSTLTLARALGAPILAIDLHPKAIQTLEARAREAGLAELVIGKVADMGTLALPAGSADLVWSEGALYSIGFGAAVSRCAEWLAPGGWLVATELCWTSHNPSDAARAFWEKDYPAMTDVPGTIERIEGTGLRVEHRFSVLPDGWEAFYGPLGRRVTALEAELVGDDPDAPEPIPRPLAEWIADVRAEIALWRQHGKDFGYVFFLCRKPD